jgi:3-deoxy-D-manno-octulosonic-acid transferase
LTLPRFAYTTLLRLATPALLAHFRRRTRRQTGTTDDWRARLGYVERDARQPIWIHAASAGEMQAALPLAAKLAEDYPLRLSAFTTSGLARAVAHLPDVPATLAPIDTPGAWRRYLKRTHPRLLVLVETELWPNLLAACARRNIPVVLVSARMTPANVQRMARFPKTTRETLAGLDCVLAQTDGDLERFRALGVPPENSLVSGNLKEARTISEQALQRGRSFRTGPLAGRAIWVAGSVREGEEAFIAETAAIIRKKVAKVVALIAPRHPERAPAFREALAARGIEALPAEALDSNEAIAEGGVILVDRLGVLPSLYAAGDAAFVGGSIVPLGGHNLLEPALLALPILAGPHLENVREQAERLSRVGALSIAEDAPTLADKIIGLLNDPSRAREAGEAGKQSAVDSRVLTVTLEHLSPLLKAGTGH